MTKYTVAGASGQLDHTNRRNDQGCTRLNQ